MALEALEIRTVFDLRTAAERELWPECERLPAGIDYRVADVLRDAPDGSPAQFAPLMADIERVRALLADGRGERMFLRRYRDFINLSSARQALHGLLSDLAVPGRTPAIVHCTTGKDRTGWAIAVLQLLAGVSEVDVMADYLASNASLAGWSRPLLDEFAARGGDPSILAPLVTVQPAYLEAGLALGPLTIQRLRAIFVEGD